MTILTIFDFNNGASTKYLFKGGQPPGNSTTIMDTATYTNISSILLNAGGADLFTYQWSSDLGLTWGSPTVGSSSFDLDVPPGANGFKITRTAGTGTSIIALNDSPRLIQLTGNMPISEATNPVIGTGLKASRDDHVHKRLSSITGPHTLDVNGECIVTFTRLFSIAPGVVPSLVELVDNPPVVFKIKSWTVDGASQITGCIVKGYRLQTLPNLSALTLVTQLITALSLFDVSRGIVTGATFMFVALDRS